MLVKTQCGKWHKTLIINMFFLKVDASLQCVINTSHCFTKIVLDNNWVCYQCTQQHTVVRLTVREKHEVDG